MAKDQQARQNIIAITDDLAARIKSLQDLYLVGGEQATMDFILDRAVSVLQANIDAGYEDERDDFVGK